MSNGKKEPNDRRIGHWCWTLSRDETVTDDVVSRSRKSRIPVAPDVKRQFADMMMKQRRLLADMREA